MAPRRTKSVTPNPIPLAQVIANNVRVFREGRVQLTQGELAAKMADLGFSTWSRTTVAEVEGKGRGRGIGLAELLGLAVALEVSVADLALVVGDQPIELAPGGITFKSMTDLVALVIPVDVTKDLAVGFAEAGMRREIERLRRIEIDRLQAVAEELRGTANWLEEKATALVTETEEAGQ